MNAIDTNILIYCHDSRDPQKQQASQRVLEINEPVVLLWQVGCEFISASKKLEPFGFTIDDAWNALADLCALAEKIALPTPDLWNYSKSLQDRHGLHFWDSLIIAACIHEGVKKLYTENFGNLLQIEGVNIIHPF